MGHEKNVIYSKLVNNPFNEQSEKGAVFSSILKNSIDSFRLNLVAKDANQSRSYCQFSFFISFHVKGIQTWECEATGREIPYAEREVYKCKGHQDFSPVAYCNLAQKQVVFIAYVLRIHDMRYHS